MAGLDKSRAYGIVYGDDSGRAFEQDGRFFNGAGRPWVDPAAAAAPEAPLKKPVAASKSVKAAPAPAAAPDEAQLSAQLEGGA